MALLYKTYAVGAAVTCVTPLQDPQSTMQCVNLVITHDPIKRKMIEITSKELVSFISQWSTSVDLLAILLLLAGDVEKNPGPPLDLKTLWNELKEAKDQYCEIGIQLGVALEEIKSIEIGHPTVDRRLTEVLNFWHKGNTRVPVCWESIVNALENVDKKVLAGQLCVKYCLSKQDIRSEANGQENSQTAQSIVKRKASDMSVSSSLSSIPSSPLSPMSPLQPPFPKILPDREGQIYKENMIWTESVLSMKSSFSSLHELVSSKLKVDAGALRVYINEMLKVDIPSEHDTTEKVFRFLTEKEYWDYWNHRLLVHIVKKFARQDKAFTAQFDAGIKEYKERLTGHLASIDIVEYLANEPHNHEQTLCNRDELKFKLKEVNGKALTFIDELWDSLEYLDLIPYEDAYLASIKGGCVVVTWLIRTSKSPDVREKAKDATKYFVKYNVIWVMINDDYIYRARSDIPEEIQSSVSKPASGALKEDRPDDKEESQLQPESEEAENKKKTQSLYWQLQSTIVQSTIVQSTIVKPVKQFSQWIQKKRLDLIGASRDNNIDVVKDILEQEDVNINMTESDKHAWTALMWACEKGNLEIAQLLIEHGAEVDADAKDNKWTSLILASRRGHLKVVQLLLSYGAKVGAQTNDGSTALIWALYEGHNDISKLLIDNGADVNVEEETGWTPVMRASNKGNAEMVKLLCERGADLNHQGDRGWTALMAATNHNHKEVVDVLIEKGAEVNLKMTDAGEPALHVACYRGHTEIAEALLAAGSEKSVCNKEGLTALMLATNRGHLDTVDRLVAGGVNIDQPHETTGWTALFLAAKAGKLDMFRKLLAYGASTEILGIKVTDVASYFKRSEILKEVNKIRQLQTPPSVPVSSTQPPHSPLESTSTKQECSVDVEVPRPSESSVDVESVELQEVKSEPVESTPPIGPLKEVTDDTAPEADAHPPQGTDAAQEESQEVEDAISPTTPTEGVAAPQKEAVTETQELGTDEVQPPKPQPKDIKLNMQQMELILKAFEQRMWKALESRSNNREQSKQKQIPSVEEITHQDIRI